MKPRRLGCLTGAGLLAALITLLLVSGVFLLGGGRMFSPGPLNAQASGVALGNVMSHAETSGDCAACHTAPWNPTTMAERCLVCHTAIATDLAAPATLHGALQVQGADMDCRQCHTEHRGPSASLTIAEMDNFPHDVVGFSLAGHGLRSDGAPFACQDCHNQSLTRFNVLTCDACHNQIDTAFMQAHVADFGTACLDCHDGIDSYSRANFVHSRIFALTGRHADVTCIGCHVGARSSADLQATPTDCVACHVSDDAHGGQLGHNCAACHNTGDWRDATFDHSRTAFPLTGQHEAVECAACHADQTFRGTPTTCVACHAADDAHDGALGQECAACHVTSDWREVAFDHSLTAFPLTGQHAAVECAACHADQTFRGTPTTCVACHAADDAHDGALGQECAACHVTSDWREVAFDHSLTAFPLTGQHAAVECAACHADQTFRGTPTTCVACHAADDAHDGALGQECAACHVTSDWREVAFDHSLTAFPLTGQHAAVECAACHADQTFRGTPTTCVACHAADDAHDGALGQECAACHVTSDWREVAFDHSLTAFPLTGQHTAVECAACHADQTFRGTPTTCVACHAADDAHDGQFGTDCAVCHNTSDWRAATFDHSRTAFPLTGQHTTVACTACHANQLFRGTPTNCVACHVEPAFHAGAFSATCNDCHTTAAWLPARFDAPHTFPFNHGDAGVNSCRTCHVAQVQSYTCYQCHDQAEMAEEHLKEGIADFQSCASCHPTGEKDEARDRGGGDD
jgi:hypothetical protein